MIDIKTGIESKTDDENLKNLDLEINSNDILLLGPCLAKNSILKDIASMIEFDII